MSYYMVFAPYDPDDSFSHPPNPGRAVVRVEAPSAGEACALALRDQGVRDAVGLYQLPGQTPFRFLRAIRDDGDIEAHKCADFNTSCAVCDAWNARAERAVEQIDRACEATSRAAQLKDA